MLSLVNKNKKWLSLVMIFTVLASIVLPNGLIRKAYAAPVVVAGWTFPNTGTITPPVTATSGDPVNTTNAIFSISGGRSATGSANNTIFTSGWNGAGGYWQVQINTLGYSQLTLSSINYGSSTGPKDFKIQYSTDGTTFTDVTNGAFVQGSSYSATAFGPNNLVLPAAVENQPNVYIRWLNYTTTSIGNGTTAAGGNSRIANIAVMGVQGAQSTLPDASKITFDSPTHVMGASGAVNGGADVKVFLSDNSIAGTGTADTNGAFDLTINNPNSDSKVFITSQESGKPESGKVSVDLVGAIPKTANPDVSKITLSDDYTTVIGVAGAVYGGAAVNVYLPDNTPVGTATAQSDGSFSLAITNAAQSPTISVTASASGGTESDKVNVSVQKTANPVASKITFSNSTSVIGIAGAVPNSAAVNVYFDDLTMAGTATAEADGSFNLTISNPSSKNAVYVTAKAAGKFESDKSTVNLSVPGAIFSPGDVVFSQLYVNGGNSGAFYKTKFFEFYNTTDHDINFNNEWAIIYTSATGTAFGAGTKLTGMIKAHGYYLVAGNTGATGAALSVTADQTTTINPSGSAGGILALANSTTGLSSQDDPKAIDIVAFGNGTNTNFSTKTDHWGSPFYNMSVGGGTILRRTDAGSDPRVSFGLGNGFFSKDPSKDFVLNAPNSASNPEEIKIRNSKYMVSPDASKISFTNSNGNAAVTGAAGSVPASSTVKAYMEGAGVVSSVGQATAAADGSFSLNYTSSNNSQPVYLTYTDASQPVPKESVYARVDAAGNPGAVVPIYQLSINDANGLPLNIGYSTTIEGVVTSANNALGTEKTNFFVQDSTDGIDVIGSQVPAVPIQLGHKVKVAGKLAFTAGNAQFVPTSIIDEGADTAPNAAAITLDSLSAYATAEPLEGKLVSFNAKVTNVPTTGPDYNVTVTDSANNTAIVRILGTSGIDVSGGAVALGETYTFIGIVGQNKLASPYTGGYYLLPRNAADVKGDLQLDHTPLLKAYTGIDVSFKATAKFADSVKIWYKGQSNPSYSSALMVSADGLNYNGKILKANMPTGKLMYYIEAQGNGQTKSVGNAAAPITIAIVADTDGPEIYNMIPLGGDQIETKHPVISANMDDPNGVDSATLSIKIDNVDFTSKAVLSAGGLQLTLSTADDLSEGDHTVTVSAKDMIGNLSTHDWTFKVLPRFAGGNHYYGSTHNHTQISHDAAGSPEDALKAAQFHDYDWFAFSDHSHDIDSSLVGSDTVDHNGMPERTGGSNWQLTKSLANQYTKDGPGGFVVFPAFEMTSTTWGHSNVFGTTNFIDRVQSGGKYQNLQDYYAWVLTYDNIVAQFNHPAMSANAFDNFIPYDKNVNRLFTMLEVGNGSGKYSYANAENKFFNALDLGWHVAPTYGEDNHDATWGQTKQRTVIVANDLSQESLLEAMRKMHVYMTEDPNAKLDVLASGWYMGSTVDTKNLQFNITGSDSVLENASDPKYSFIKTTSNDNIAKVELITNGGSVIDTYNPSASSPSTSFNWTPTINVVGGQQWFVVRVTQQDGDRIYSSPIWSPAEAVSVKVSNVIAVDGAIIGGLSANLQAGISNLGTVDVSNITAHFYYDVVDSAHLIGDSEIPSIKASKAATASVAWANPLVGDHKIIVVLASPDNNLGDNKYEQSFSIKAPLGKTIMIDASKNNENTTKDTGTYKDNLKLFTTLIRQQGYSVVENANVLSDSVLSNAAVLYISHPASAYSTAEITAINKFVTNGGSLLMTEKSNFGGSNQNLNAVLSGVGSSILVNNDGVFDETAYGNFWGTPLTSNFSVRAHPTPVSNNLTDFVPTIEYYSGSSLAKNDGTGNKAALNDSGPVTVLVRGNETTFQDSPSIKADTVSYNVQTSKSKATPPGPALTDITGGSAIPMIASETVGSGRIIVSGMNIFNDKQMDQTYNPKGNDPFAVNVVNWLSHLEPQVVNIADARTKAEGTNAVVQGKVTTAAGNFYDSVYVQDDTGGIMAFSEVPAGTLQLGDTIRVYGHIKTFENNKELEFDKFANSIVKVSSGAPLEPKTVSTKESVSDAYQGQLVKVTGIVKSIPDEASYMINDGSGDVLVFVDGYIVNQSGPIPKLKVGDTLEAVGLSGKFSEGDRIRVRDTKELKKIITDETPPVTTIQIEGSTQNGWFRSNVAVILAATDVDSGVAKTEYKLAEAEQWTEYQTPISFTNEGEYVLQFRSVDQAGNVEEAHAQAIRIDRTAPTYKLTANGLPFTEGKSFTDDTVLTFHLTSEDSLSGLANQTLTLDGKTYEDGSKVDLAGKLGVHTIGVAIVDKAGNQVRKEISFNITTNLQSLQKLIDRYVAAKQLKDPLAVQLKNSLDQADHQYGKGSLQQAAKFMDDFLKHLNNKAMQGNVTIEAKGILEADAKNLIDKWSK
jgi:hypothetical protein